MLGDYIRTITKPNLKKYKFIIGASLASVGILICGFVRLIEINGDFSIFRGMSVYSSVSPIVIFIAISFFLSFARSDIFEESKIIAVLSKQSYFMYLWHPFVIEILFVFLRNTGLYKWNYIATLFIVLIITSMVAFILSWCTSTTFKIINERKMRLL